jgi:S1-C subfamily serine protease
VVSNVGERVHVVLVEMEPDSLVLDTGDRRRGDGELTSRNAAGTNDHVRHAIPVVDEESLDAPHMPVRRVDLGVAVDAREVVVSLDGRPILSAADLSAALAELAPGRTVPVGLETKAGQRTVDVRLGQRPPA